MRPAAPIVRELPRAEFGKLAACDPFVPYAWKLEKIRARVIDAETAETGQIVACWAAFDAVHLDPLWIAAAYRRRPKLALQLLDAMRAVLAECGVSSALAIIADPTVAAMAERLGFEPIPGQLYLLRSEGS